MGIGQQLRVEDTATKQPEPLPDRLAVLLKRFEGGEIYTKTAGVRPTSMNVESPAPAASKTLHPAPASPIPNERSSRRLIALGKFEKLVLDLFDNHLRGPEREAAVRKFTAYVRACHTMLELGFIKESELTGDVSRPSSA